MFGWEFRNGFFTVSILLLAKILLDCLLSCAFSEKIQTFSSVWNGLSFQRMALSRVRPGNLVFVEQNQKSPYSMLVLSALDSQIQILKTSNLLTFKHPVKETQEIMGSNSLEELSLVIQSLNFKVSFEEEKVKLKLEDFPKSTELLKDNFIRKGCTLLSGWVVGLVVENPLKTKKSCFYFQTILSKLEWILVLFLTLILGTLFAIQGNIADLVFYYSFSLVLVPLPLSILLDTLRFFYLTKFQKRFPGITFNRKLLNENLAKVKYFVFSKSNLLKNEDLLVNYCCTPTSRYQLDKSYVEKSTNSSREESILMSSRSFLSSSNQSKDLLREERLVQALALCNSIQLEHYKTTISPEDIAIENLLDKLMVRVSKSNDSVLLKNLETAQSFQIIKSQPSKSSKVRALVENLGSFYLFVRGSQQDVEGALEEQDFGNGVPICYAVAVLSQEEVEQFISECDYAASLPCSERINQVFEKYERNLSFLGAIVVSVQVNRETKKTLKKMESVGIKHVLVSSDSYEHTLNAAVASGMIGNGNSVVEIENSVSPLALKSDLKELLNGLLFSEFDQSLAVGPQGFSKSFSERLSHFRDSSHLRNVYYEFMDPENKLFGARIKYDKKRNIHPFIDEVLGMNDSELLSFKRTYKPNKFDLVLTGEVFKHALGIQENRLYLAVLFLLADSVVVGSLSKKKLVYDFIKECSPNSSVLSFCPQIDSGLNIGKSSEFEIKDYKALRKLIFSVGVPAFLALKKTCELYFYQTFFAFALNSVFLIYSGLSSSTVTGLTFYEVLAYLISALNIGLAFTSESPEEHKEIKSLKFIIKGLLESTLHSLIINFGLILTYTSTIDSEGFTENQDLLTSCYAFCFYFTIQLKVLLSVTNLTLCRITRSLLLTLIATLLVFLKYGVSQSPFYTVFSSPKLALVVLTLPLVNFVSSYGLQKVSLGSQNQVLYLKKSIKLYKSKFLKVQNKNIEDNYKIDKLTLSFQEIQTNEKYYHYTTSQNLKKYRVVVLIFSAATIFFRVWQLFSSKIEFSYFLIVELAQGLFLGIIYFTKLSQKYTGLVNFAFGVYCLIITLAIRNIYEEVTPMIYTLIPVIYCFGTYVSWKQALFLSSFSLLLTAVDFYRYFRDNGFEGFDLVLETIYFAIFYAATSFNCLIIAYQQNYVSLKDYRLNQIVEKKAETAHNIVNFLFPQEISLKLINGDHSLSKFHDSVTIVFCNICEFDQIVNYFSPEDLTAFLDRLFTKFDRLCNTLGASKVETVGYTFLACFGLSEKDELSSMKGLQLASWMISEAQNVSWKQNEYVKLNIGVNTGSIISGVVGYHKPQFVLVGDTINTASRMASTLENYNSIQVSRSTFELLGDFQNCEFLEKEVSVKGKGLMQTHMLSKLSNQVLEFSGLKRRPEILRNTKTEIPSPQDEITEDMRTKKIRDFSPMFKAQILNTIIMTGLLAFISIIEFGVLQDIGKLFRGIISTVLYVLLYTSYLTLRKSWEKRCFAFIYQSAMPFLLVTLLLVLYSREENIEATCMGVMGQTLIVTHWSFLEFKYALSTLILIGILVVLDEALTPTIGLFNTVLILFFSVLCLVTLYLRDKQFEAFILSKSRLNKQLERTETLLNRVLPEHVYRGLKEDQLLTDIYPDMTILYADIVGFTSWSSQKGPEEVLSMLSKMFAKFDESCLKHNVYKVHTIGDCYVVLGSSSKVRDPVVECYNVVDFAKEMIGTIEEVNLEEGMDLSMRIGIHTGTVTAGISGTTIVRYDIYGRDVTIANKMESNGVPGKIAVSESTKQVLEAVDTPYCFEEGPLVELKEPFTTFRSYLLSY